MNLLYYMRCSLIGALSRYNVAREWRDKQDEFCVRAEAGLWEKGDKFPESFKWEALVDVLRGRVKIHNHCYEVREFGHRIRTITETFVDR
jgi:hypothetical protein